MRSAEEAASVLATSISPEQCIKVLCPIIQTADYPINLAAIKMQTKVIERVSKETLNLLLPEIMPGLIQVSSKTWFRKKLCWYTGDSVILGTFQATPVSWPYLPAVLGVQSKRLPIASSVCVCVGVGGGSKSITQNLLFSVVTEHVMWFCLCTQTQTYEKLFKKNGILFCDMLCLS